jgi:hypothetical protein
MRKQLLSSCIALGMGAAGAAQAATFVSDDADRFNTVAEAISAGVWDSADGATSISTNYAHSGTKSYKLSFPANESVSYLNFRLPSGKSRVFVRWWELRERAGDFAGANDYDWSAEKTLRLRSSTIGSVGIDYCLGWEAASGQRGTSGTDGPGNMVIFGNSSASNDANLLTVRPNGISRGQWNMIEMEINLGTAGRTDGAVRLWVNDVLIGETTGVSLLPAGVATIDQVWVGGWYSGLSPNPSPANRYIDDIVIADQKIGGTAQIRPSPPRDTVAQ